MKLANTAKNSKKIVKTEKKSVKDVSSLSSIAVSPPSGIVGILKQIVLGHGLDGAPAWLVSSSRKKKYIASLCSSVIAPKQEKTSKYIVITGLKRLIFWKLESLNGDTYTRIHPKDSTVSKDTPVKGSVRLLKSVFPTDSVKIASFEAVQKLRGSLKSDVSCLRAA